jgi:hypothetical protein
MSVQPCAALAGEPFRQRQQFLGGGLEGTYLAPYGAVGRVPHAGHDRVLVHVQAGAMRVENFHAPSCGCAAGLGSRHRNSRNRAPEPSPAHGAIGGAPGSRVQLTHGLSRTIKKADLCADGAGHTTIDFAPVSSLVGRQRR